MTSEREPEKMIHFLPIASRSLSQQLLQPKQPETRETQVNRERLQQHVSVHQQHDGEDHRRSISVRALLYVPRFIDAE